MENKKTDFDETIDRLIKENSFLSNLMNQGKYELFSVKELEGLSFLGAIKSLVKKYCDQQNEIHQLKQKIKELSKNT